jgi:glc operon protein GlcG
MTLRTFATIALATGLLTASAAYAQQQPPAPPNLDAVPDKMPFATPYGAPITLDRAQGLIQAAVAEGNKRGWAMNIAVVDPNGDVLAFARMDGAQLASIAIKLALPPAIGVRRMHWKTVCKKRGSIIY